MEHIYLDHNATTPPDSRVREAMALALLELWGNPSSMHRHGQKASAMIEEARENVAAMLKAAPNEVYFRQRPASRSPRIEPRPDWPRSSPCARPQALVAGQPGDRFTFQLDSHRGRTHLPVVTLKRAA